MYYILKRLNRFVEFYTDCSMAHGLDDCVSCNKIANQHKIGNDTCESCTYGSDFGSGETDTTGTIKYMAERIAVYSQTLMASSTPLAFGAKGGSYFKDCENFRKCNETNNNPPCTDNTLCNGNNAFSDDTE